MKNRGFTLIEMLVVISIISLISSIALGSITVARRKSVDALIKTNLVNAMPQAEIYFSSNTTNPNSYHGVCSGGAQHGINPLILGAALQSRQTLVLTPPSNTDYAACVDKPDDSYGPTGWAAEIRLTEDQAKWWCVDSTGRRQVNTSSTLGVPSGSPPNFRDVSCL